MIRPRRTPLLRVATIALLVAFLGSAPALTVPREKDKWIRVESENFVLFSDASASRATEIAESLERLRETLARFWKGMRFTSPRPMYIYVFRNERSFAPYKPSEDGKPDRKIAGYFLRTRDANYVTINASANLEHLRVVYHEYVHYVLEANGFDLPLWLDEGLAELYSTFQVQGKRAEIGRPLDNHVYWLSSNRLIPISRLFEIDSDSPEYDEGDRRGTFYAQSWALTHYLMLGNDDRLRRFNELVHSLEQGDAAPDALSKVYGMDLPTMEKRLEDYTNQRAYRGIYVDFEKNWDPGAVAIHDMDRSEVLVRLADLLARYVPLQAGAARQHLDQALRIAPDDSGAHTVLGVLEAAQGHREQATELYRKAAKLDPGNARAWALLGMGLVDQYFESLGPSATMPDETPPLLAEARESLRKSLKIDPDGGEVLATFGRTYLQDTGDVTEGIEALERAARVLPKRTDVLYNLVILYVRNGDRDKAVNVIENVLARTADEDVVLRARDTLLELDVRKAQDLAALGRLDEAKTLLRDAVQRANDPTMKAAIDSMLQSLDRAVPSNGVDDRDDHAFDLHGQAVAAANAGDLETAIDLLERVVEQSDDEALRATAQSQLDRMRAVARQNSAVDRYNQAAEAANAGDLATAVELLEGVLEQTEDEDDLRAAAQSQLLKMRAAARFNEGIELIRAGNMREARAVFEALLTSDPPADVRQNAEKMIAEIDRHSGGGSR